MTDEEREALVQKLQKVKDARARYAFEHLETGNKVALKMRNEFHAIVLRIEEELRKANS
jgi:hypothetical protein